MSEFDYRFSIIPAAAVIDHRLKARDLQVLCLLGRHTNKLGWCRRSQVKMAQELGCSRGTVQGSLDRLTAAGYVQKRAAGRGVVPADPSKQPFASHEYRVSLDLDDATARDAQNAWRGRITDEAEQTGDLRCQPDGTPPVGPELAPGASPELAPGASPELAPGASPGVGTRVPTYGLAPLEGSLDEDSPCEPEREGACAREDRHLAEFRKVWPTTALDDAGRTELAWSALPDRERRSAIDGVKPFLEELKRHRRSSVPAGWRYLDERRWAYLEKPAGAPAAPASVVFKAWSREWWAVLLKRLRGGEPVRLMVAQAIERSRQWAEHPDKMPSAEEIAALRPFPSDAECMKQWRLWFQRHRVELPLWRERIWVFLPGPDPPVEHASAA